MMERKTAVADDPMLYRELSFRIIGAAIEVHKTLGPGFVESVYEEALTQEFAARGIPFERQRSFEVHYRDRLIGSFRTDIVVDDAIILELKAVTALNDLFKQQTLSYLKASGLRLALLINFGGSKTETVRIIH